MKAQKTILGFVGKRYGIAIFDVIGNFAIDVQYCANTIKECLPKIALHAKNVPMPCAIIYKVNRNHEAVPVKQYDSLQTAKIIAQ